jgi:Vacuolar import and degradation protein
MLPMPKQVEDVSTPRCGPCCPPCALSSILSVLPHAPADNVPKVDTPVTTFWEGSIVGVGPHTFVTGQWGADKANDWSHWQKCVERW